MRMSFGQNGAKRADSLRPGGEKVPWKEPLETASLQRVRNRLGRFRVRRLRVIAAVVDVGDPDFTGVERINRHASRHREERDASVDVRRAVPAIGDDVEQRGLLIWRGTDE